MRGRRLARAAGTCEGACTLIDLAGAQRQRMPGARPGLHRASGGTLNPVLDALGRRGPAQVHREAGLPGNFVRRLLAAPPSRRWDPARDELVDAGLVSVPVRPLDLDLPPAGPGSGPTSSMP